MQSHTASREANHGRDDFPWLPEHVRREVRHEVIFIMLG